VHKALIDLDSNINFCGDEFNLLFLAVSTIMPIKLAGDVLCHKKANILTADAAIKLLAIKIQK
jgi:hypothetical protein